VAFCRAETSASCWRTAARFDDFLADSCKIGLRGREQLDLRRRARALRAETLDRLGQQLLMMKMQSERTIYATFRKLGFARGACRVQPYRLMRRVEKTMPEPEPEIVAQLAKRSRRRKPQPDVPRDDDPEAA
jgi:hypothetical protein